MEKNRSHVAWVLRCLAVGMAALVASGIGVSSARADAARLAVSHLTRLGVSPRLADLPPAHFAAKRHEIPLHRPPAPGPGPAGPGGGVQTAPGPQLPFAAGPKISGIGYNGSYPPDPNLAVGKTILINGKSVGYIVQVANTEIAVYDKTNLNAPPIVRSLGDMWAGTGTSCTGNSGDPIVQYDEAADRWLITQIGSITGPWSECIAVSQTRDPTGAYNRYQDTQFGNNYLNDYPKFTVWPTASNSAYLASYNLFIPFPPFGYLFDGAELCAYDRAAMLRGTTASSICTTPGTVSTPSYLPSDADGPTPPADGTPGYFLDFPTTSSLRLYQLSPNFATGGGTLTQAPDIAVAAFSEACGGQTCIPQPTTTTSQQLDSLGDRLMYRLAYRVFSGNHVAMVVNHSVAAGTSVGVRWYELRAPVGNAGKFGLYQQGTYAPDAAFRWMGSMAMDGAGDIAVGYSRSSSTLYPSIAVTGRIPSTPLGILGGEAVLMSGTGAQTGASRWGDYTALRIDPDDDATFWYTNEYYSASSANSWSTFIGSFTIAQVPPPPAVDFSLSLSSGSLTVKRGSSNNLTVTMITKSGTPSVALTTSGLPPHTLASYSVNPVTTTSAQSTLTITAASKTPRGSTSVTVGGTDPSGSSSSQFILTIQ